MLLLIDLRGKENILKTRDYLKEHFKINEALLDLCEHVLAELAPQFKAIDDTADFNQLKVLAAMQQNRLSDTHFAATTGYGYNDLGRDTLEQIYADVFRVEAALVRPQMISGTHAIATALFGNLRYGDALLALTGKPYDTLEKVIGIKAAKGSLAEQGVTYHQADLAPDGGVDYAAIRALITPQTKIAAIQRSKGYAWRRSFTVAEIGEMIAFVKRINPDIICFVDNCYGEFVDTTEPTEVGADLAAGSLIKNPGGGLAPVGGYIVGKAELVGNAAFRLTAPGVGKEAGPGLGLVQPMTQGLFLAPNVVAGALKGAVFAAAVFAKHGFAVNPASDEKRSDIVQAIQLNNAENIMAFCRGIQRAAPMDAFVTPEPWAMPGYNCPVIMAAGAFVQGSSIELSADAPMRPPFAAYLQGGLTWSHAKIGVMVALNALLMGCE